VTISCPKGFSAGSEESTPGRRKMSRVVENIEEVVLAVQDQDKAVALFEDLFGLEFKDSWTVPADSMRVKCAKVGNTQFHIVTSLTPDALIAKFIAQKGEGIHHIAFRVRNLDETISRLKEKKVKLIPETPRTRERKRYVFVHPGSAHGMLIELIEIQE
jgi:methylmalonyl-CoA epimerase